MVSSGSWQEIMILHPVAHPMAQPSIMKNLGSKTGSQDRRDGILSLSVCLSCQSIGAPMHIYKIMYAKEGKQHFPSNALHFPVMLHQQQAETKDGFTCLRESTIPLTHLRWWVQLGSFMNSN